MNSVSGKELHNNVAAVLWRCSPHLHHKCTQVPTPTLSQHATHLASQSSRRSVGNSVSQLGEAVHQAVGVGRNKTNTQTGRPAPVGAAEHDMTRAASLVG